MRNENLPVRKCVLFDVFRGVFLRKQKTKTKNKTGNPPCWLISNFAVVLCGMSPRLHTKLIIGYFCSALKSEHRILYGAKYFFIKISHDWVKTEVGRSAEYCTRGYKPDRRWDIIFVRLLSTVSHFLVLPFLCLQHTVLRKSAEVRVQVKNWFAVGM